MLIGLISDTHDNLPQIEKAITYLNTVGVQLVLHAGDYCAPFTITKFKTLNCKLVGVFGNNDGDQELLKTRFNETQNCEIHGRFTQIDIDNYKIALLHGDEPELLLALLYSQRFNALIHGHTHNKNIEQRENTLIINSGELCGYITGKSTLATLYIEKNEAHIVEL
ncbi:MAG: metallophosphoesterase [Nitrososphaerota archaeon]|jgi:putative phosphoesterase|nr:metallophosphoesterase [Nitrososphaerota archaeon]